MADMMMSTEKKYYDKDDFASKGVGGTALGLSIGALGLELLKNGGLNNVLGTQQTSPEESSFNLYKNQRDIKDEILAKHNADAFGLYKNSRDEYDALKAQIDAINTKIAVQEATQPYQYKSVMDAIALEAERRACNDNKIISYVNGTFAPRYISEFTVGTGTTQASIFNPLCCNPCQVTM